MKDNELISMIALGKIPGLGAIGARNLLKAMGSAENIFLYRKELADRVPGVGKRLINALDCPDAFVCAEKELLFASKSSISCVMISDKDYPSRLRECDDAPLVLYFKGNTDLNSVRVISIVGTRNITEYGQQVCCRFIQDIKNYLPDLLIVSGLAYGVDIHAHRSALSNGLPTVGVLAHGLDRIYPSVHRNTAVEMLEQGGLLTEFMSGTNPDRQNFIKRNRIVAGMSDATVVVESAVKGGALITAELAGSYHRDCFAFPGRLEDEFSQGCNHLIRDNKAALIQNAEDLIKAMCWEVSTPCSESKPIQRQLFPDLTEEEQKIVSILQKEESIQINNLVVEANIPVNRMSALLFELEMKGLVRVMAGGMYRLLA